MLKDLTLEKLNPKIKSLIIGIIFVLLAGIGIFSLPYFLAFLGMFMPALWLGAGLFLGKVLKDEKKKALILGIWLSLIIIWFAFWISEKFEGGNKEIALLLLGILPFLFSFLSLFFVGLWWLKTKKRMGT